MEDTKYPVVVCVIDDERKVRDPVLCKDEKARVAAGQELARKYASQDHPGSWAIAVFDLTYWFPF